MVFSSREIKILKFLLKSPSTSQKLAEHLNVSRRTVLRDLPVLSKKLKTFGIVLKTKTGLGISLKGSKENISKLKERLSLADISPKLSPKDRRYLIMLSLLEQKEPQKLLTFALEYQVTEATISYDLDACEHVFLKYNLKLMRRPGVGVWVEGSEKDVRQLITDLVYKNFSEGQLVSILKDKLPIGENNENSNSFILSDEIKNRLLKLMNANLIEQIERVLKKILNELKFPLTDSAYVGLIVHIALAMERLKSGEHICMKNNVLSALKSSNEFKLAEKLGACLEEIFSIKIPEDEMGYITMHLLGAKLRTTDVVNDFFDLDNIEVADMAKTILIHAGNQLGENLVNDIIALEGLILHLRPAISRLRLGMDIRNPLLPQLKQNYKKLIEVAYNSVEPLGEKYGLKVPESELGYIAMHIGAALERRRYKKFPVILACASGIGSTQMLASRLHKELPQIDIIDVVSFLDLNHSIKKYPYVDTVITTVPFKSDVLHVIEVSPLLEEADVEKIKAQLKVVEKNNSIPTFPYNELRYRNGDYRNQVILDLVQSFALKDNIIVNSKDELLGRLAKLLKNDIPGSDINEVVKDLHNRENYGGCAVPGRSVFMLHTRTKGTRKPFFGVYRLKKPIQAENMDGKIENVETILIMLLPESSHPEARDVMGKISVALLEDSYWIQLLRKGSSIDIVQELVKITR